MTLAAGAALLALAASPLRVVVHPGDSATIAVRNLGAAPAAVAVAPAGYRLDLRGRPLLGGATHGWLAARPARLVLRPGATGTVAVRASAPPGARAGDHARVLLLAASAQGARGVRVSVRLGVVVVVRCAGALRRRLEPLALRLVAPRVLRLVVANRGNLDEWVGARRLALRLERAGRPVAVLHTRARRLLAGSRGVFEWRLPRLARGPLRIATLVGGRVVRRYRLRL